MSVPKRKRRPEERARTSAHLLPFEERCAFKDEQGLRRVEAPGGELVVKTIKMDEVETDGPRGLIRGYANTKKVWDAVNDIGRDGCYAWAIEQFGKYDPPRIKFLLFHNWSNPIGLPVEMEEDSTGLLWAGKVAAPGEGEGKRALILADEGVLDAFSIGFRLKASDYNWIDPTDLDPAEAAQLQADPWWWTPREILTYRIYEISLVPFPANEESRVTEVIKSIDRHLAAVHVKGWRPDAPAPTQAPAGAGGTDSKGKDKPRQRKGLPGDVEQGQAILGELRRLNRSNRRLHGEVRRLRRLQGADTKGAMLGDLLDDLVEDLVDDDSSRNDIIQRLADAAGVGAAEVQDIISGADECPELAALEAFASELGVDLADLQAAAESDGCTYGDDDDEGDDDDSDDTTDDEGAAQAPCGCGGKGKALAGEGKGEKGEEKAKALEGLKGLLSKLKTKGKDD